jgi:chromosome segregation ATPase
MDARAAADLEELARRDHELSAGAARLRGLDADVAAIRERSEAIDSFFASYGDEETRRGEAVRAATADLARRRDELSEAERELAAARDPETRERAESAAQRARDHVAVAESAVDRARGDAEELEREASLRSREVPELEARARAVSAEADDVPPAPTGVRELVAWASRAHAELFVAAGQLDAQRDRVIREANELATMVLGEPTYGSTVAQLAQRVLPLARE